MFSKRKRAMGVEIGIEGRREQMEKNMQKHGAIREGR
jgi:hypothetical protein